MATETALSNKAAARRYYEEAFNGRRPELVGELAVEDYVEHDPFPGMGNGRADLENRVRGILAAMSPMRFEIEDMIEEGDRVVVRWTQTATHSGPFMGIPATGRTVTVAGIDIHRFRDGRMAEHWHVVDQLALLQQLGVLPGPEQG